MHGIKDISNKCSNRFKFTAPGTVNPLWDNEAGGYLNMLSDIAKKHWPRHNGGRSGITDPLLIGRPSTSIPEDAKFYQTDVEGETIPFDFSSVFNYINISINSKILAFH